MHECCINFRLLCCLNFNLFALNKRRIYLQDLDAVETAEVPDDQVEDSVAPSGEVRRNTVQYSRHDDSDENDDERDSAAELPSSDEQDKSDDDDDDL